MERQIKIALLKNENPRDFKLWLKACEERGLKDVTVIDLSSSNWLEEVKKEDYDLFLLRPPGQKSIYKQLYDERVWIIKNVLKKNIYPSAHEVFIYENKRFLRDWLMAHELPHPNTAVIFNEQEAIKWIEEQKAFPIVAKTNIGASGKGVSIFSDKKQSLEYIKTVFNSGVSKKRRPKLFKGSILKKIKKVVQQKDFVKHRLQEYKAGSQEVHKDFVIFQEFIPHTFEWRCVVINDSYFAHKKIVVGDKSSGTLKKGYDPVPEKLLEFIKQVCDKGKLSSVAIDVFEHNESYLINEIQCFFGQSDPYQMLEDGKPGRYRYIDQKWIFEEGMFNTNECFDLRIDHALKSII